MSCIYKCDRCGKIIDTSERIVPKGDGTYEIAEASRIKLSGGLRDYDLCLSCKTELYDWLHGAWLHADKANSQIIAVAKASNKEAT